MPPSLAQLRNLPHKYRFIVITTLFCLLSVALGSLCVGVWHAAVMRGSPDEATNYDITLASLYVLFYSCNYLLYDKWVFENNNGSYTLDLLFSKSDRTFNIMWLNRFCTGPGWIIVSSYYTISVLTAPNHAEATRLVRGPFLSGALIASIDLMLELRAGTPLFFVHHAVAITATLLACEYGHFDIAVSMYSLQAAHDKMVWIIFFFSRLKVARDRNWSTIQNQLEEGKKKNKLASSSSSSCPISHQQLVVAVNSTGHSEDSCYIHVAEPDSSSFQDIIKEEEEKEEEEKEEEQSPLPPLPKLQGSSTTTTITTVVEDSLRSQAQPCSPSLSARVFGSEPFGNSNSSRSHKLEKPRHQKDEAPGVERFQNGAALSIIPGLSIDDPTNVTQVHQHLAYRIQMESEERGDEHWVDNLFPSYLSLSYWYCAIFVYYPFVVRLGLNGCLIAYLVKYWDDVALLWKIVHPIAGLAFLAIDYQVYGLIWRRSYWGGGQRGERGPGL